MKKALTLTLALSVIFVLFACGGKPAETPSPSAPAETTDSMTSEAPASEAPRAALEKGFFDPSIDYIAAGRYQVAYIHTGVSVMYDMLSDAFKAWADKLNVEFNSFTASDDDQFLATVQSYCDQSYDGLILDPTPAAYPAAAELLSRNNMPWMSGMAPAYDENMKLLHPAVGYDDHALGYDMYTWCIDYAKSTWPDATPENTGGIFIGYADLQLPELRRTGAYDAWLGNGYKEGSFFFLDGAAGDMTAQTAYNLAAPVMDANSKLKYWIGCGFFDDYSVGIARAAADAGKAGTAVCSTAGGTALISLWDAGGTGALKSAVCIEPRLYTEPIFCGLYAMITGRVTPASLWPEWIDRSAGQTYADLRLPAVTITQDNYKDYLAFVDTYTELDAYPYPETDATYPVLAVPPAATSASANLTTTG